MVARNVVEIAGIDVGIHDVAILSPLRLKRTTVSFCVRKNKKIYLVSSRLIPVLLHFLHISPRKILCAPQLEHFPTFAIVLTPNNYMVYIE